jgi:thioredoxin reductase
MAVDTPATIAVLGAGPIGLEAALYARFLGYAVDLYERGRVAENVLRWGHVRLFSPFGLNRSTLGLAALRAQDDAGFQPPDDAALLTGREYAHRYLIPLSRTDLLIDSLNEETEVLAIGREGPLKGDLVGNEDRIDFPFRILLRTAQGERIATADVVIDATGTYGWHNWLGTGGIPAVGELAAAEHVEYGLPDILGRDREQYAGNHTLVVGAGFSAATTIVALAELARQAAGTRATWITRGEPEAGSHGPIKLIEADRLPERHRLAAEANRLAGGASPNIACWPATTVEAIHRSEASGRFVLRLTGRHAGELEVDRVVATVGYRGDSRIYQELQVHECYATGGPMKLAAALSGNATSDCLDQRALGPQTLLNPEPDFYILGAKSYGRNSQFLISVGLEQIRELFTIIGDRPDLNLYQSILKLRA